MAVHNFGGTTDVRRISDWQKRRVNLQAEGFRTALNVVCDLAALSVHRNFIAGQEGAAVIELLHKLGRCAEQWRQEEIGTEG